MYVVSCAICLSTICYFISDIYCQWNSPDMIFFPLNRYLFFSFSFRMRFVCFVVVFFPISLIPVFFVSYMNFHLISFCCIFVWDRVKLQNELSWDDIHQRICLAYRYVGHTLILWHILLNLSIKNVCWTLLISIWDAQLILLLTKVLGQLCASGTVGKPITVKVLGVILYLFIANKVVFITWMPRVNQQEIFYTCFFCGFELWHGHVV